MDPLAPVVRWPVRHAAVGVLRSGMTGHPPGGPSPDLLGTVGPEDRPFAWASVTKPATALAVLVAVEEGTLSLSDPAGPPGSTVGHLLAHASGLGAGPGPPQDAPGRRRIYSNAGYELLAERLAERSGIPFAEYLRAGVLDPLGMVGTVLDGRAPSGGGPDAQAGPAAAGLTGPLADLLRLGREWAAPTLIGQATHREAVSVAFPGLAGVLPGFGRFDPCDWGLGVELRGAKQPHWTGTTNSPRTYGHFGRSGSFLWIDPEAGLVCAGLGDRPFGPWAARAWPALADGVLAAWGPGRVPEPGRPEPPGHPR